MSQSRKTTLAQASAATRRDVLRALGLAGGIALLGPLATRSGSLAYAAGANRGEGNLGLEVDGAVTPVESIEGGNAFAEVALEPPAEGVFRKHLSAVRFEDLIVQVPLHSAQPLMGWIASALGAGGKGPAAKSGAIVYLDINGKEVKRLEFLNAIISEVTLPACDAGTRDIAYLKLRLTPESTRLVGGSNMGKGNRTFGSAVATNTFRMNVQGLESAGPRTMKVSAAAAKRGSPPQPAGLREKPLPVALDCAPLSITLAEKDAGPYYQWFNEFVVQGNANAERAGRLEYLAADGSRVVASVDFGNLGIVRYAPLPGPGERAAGSVGGTLPLVQVDMFCETMSLTVA